MSKRSNARGDRALVRNAADPAQVRRAAERERDREVRYMAALEEVLGSPAGRFAFAELLERAGLYETSFDQSGSVMYFREGRRNFGLEIRAALEAASGDLVELLDREMRQRKRTDDRETDAAHTPRASETGGNA